MKIIEETQSLIKQANQSDNVNTLSDINLKLQGYLFFLSSEESKALLAKLEAYNKRKDFEADYCVTSSEGITKAEKMATVASRDLRQQEVMTEVAWQRIRGYRQQGNEFCDALKQKIAILRQEMISSKQQI